MKKIILWILLIGGFTNIMLAGAVLFGNYIPPNLGIGITYAVLGLFMLSQLTYDN